MAVLLHSSSRLHRPVKLFMASSPSVGDFECSRMPVTDGICETAEVCHLPRLQVVSCSNSQKLPPAKPAEFLDKMHPLHRHQSSNRYCISALWKSRLWICRGESLQMGAGCGAACAKLPLLC